MSREWPAGPRRDLSKGRRKTAGARRTTWELLL